MGNCFSRSSKNFRGEGRTLGSAPAAPTPPDSGPSNAPLPHNVSQGRKLGGSSEETGGNVSVAGQAAIDRVNRMNSGQGKLRQNLVDQKKQTRTDTLKAASEEERSRRDMEANAEARNWN